MGSQGFSGVRATSFPHLLAKALSGSYGMLGTQQELHQSPCPQGVDILPGAPTNGPQIGVSMVPSMRGEQRDVGGTTKGHMGNADRTEETSLGQAARAGRFKLLHGHQDVVLRNAVPTTSRSSIWAWDCQPCVGLNGGRGVGQTVTLTKTGSLTPPITWNSIRSTQWPGHF